MHAGECWRRGRASQCDLWEAQQVVGGKVKDVCVERREFGGVRKGGRCQAWFWKGNKGRKTIPGAP